MNKCGGQCGTILILSDQLKGEGKDKIWEEKEDKEERSQGERGIRK